MRLMLTIDSVQYSCECMQYPTEYNSLLLLCENFQPIKINQYKIQNKNRIKSQLQNVFQSLYRIQIEFYIP